MKVVILCYIFLWSYFWDFIPSGNIRWFVLALYLLICVWHVELGIFFVVNQAVGDWYSLSLGFLCRDPSLIFGMQPYCRVVIVNIIVFCHLSLCEKSRNTELLTMRFSFPCQSIFLRSYLYSKQRDLDARWKLLSIWWIRCGCTCNYAAILLENLPDVHIRLKFEKLPKQSSQSAIRKHSRPLQVKPVYCCCFFELFVSIHRSDIEIWEICFKIINVVRKLTNSS